MAFGLSSHKARLRQITDSDGKTVCMSKGFVHSFHVSARLMTRAISIVTESNTEGQESHEQISPPGSAFHSQGTLIFFPET